MTPQQKTKELRDALKAHLLNTRRQMFPGLGYVPVCSFCHGPITERQPADLHEALIKRNVVQMWPEEQRDLIFHEYNCALIHHEPCHMQYGQTEQMTHLLAQKFVYWHGADNIIRWIESLPLTPEVAQEFINIINAHRRD